MNKQISQLINTASELVSKLADGNKHTVAAAVLTESGRTICSMNLSHFTGGPCAEIAALARVVSEDEIPTLIVAVGDNERGVLSPCGKCRQIIFDYYPAMQVIMPDEKSVKSISKLLPDTYRWNNHQIT